MIAWHLFAAAFLASGAILGLLLAASPGPHPRSAWRNRLMLLCLVCGFGALACIAGAVNQIGGRV